MTVQLVLLKSGEELIADVREIIDKETEKQVSLVFINPYKVLMDCGSTLLLSEENTTEELTATIEFQKWIPISKSKEFFVSYDWVVTISEPHDDILNSYINKIGVKDDSQSDFTENTSDVNLGD